MTDSAISPSDFKAGASRLLKQLHEDPRTSVLTQNGRASAVVQDFDQFQRQQQGLLLLKMMVQGEGDIQREKLAPQETILEDMRKRLTAKKPRRA